MGYICPRCNVELNDWLVCPNCGTAYALPQQEPSPPQQPPEQPKNRNKRKIAIIVAAVLVVLSVAVSVFVVVSSNSSNAEPSSSASSSNRQTSNTVQGTVRGATFDYPSYWKIVSEDDEHIHVVSPDADMQASLDIMDSKYSESTAEICIAAATSDGGRCGKLEDFKAGECSGKMFSLTTKLSKSYFSGYSAVVDAGGFCYLFTVLGRDSAIAENEILAAMVVDVMYSLDAKHT